MPKRPVRLGLWMLAAGGCLLILAVVVLYGLESGWSLGSKPLIGVVEINGSLQRSEEILEDLIKLERDPAIKAIILRIDSPGGAVVPFQEIYREVLRTRKSKKIIASLGTVAASGGYYVAAAANRIVANPGTATGSIGVIIPITNIQGLMDKLGVDVTAITSGRYKDSGSPHRAMTEADRQYFQQLVNNINDQFIRAVADGRSMERAQVEAVADGRVVSGEQGLALGLVDQLGNFRDAVDLAKELTGIQGRAKLIWVRQESEGWLRRMIKNVLTGALRGALTDIGQTPVAIGAPR